MQYHGILLPPILFGVLATAVSSRLASGVQRSYGYGPGGCVSIERSSAGSCVLKTNCSGQDITNYDFSFDCLETQGHTVHSLGVGSFDESEEFDTDVRCEHCLPPAAEIRGATWSRNSSEESSKTSVLQLSAQGHKGRQHHHRHHHRHHVHKVPANFVSHHVHKAKAKWKPWAQGFKGNQPEVELNADLTLTKVAKYGPDDCVSTWRSSGGSCMMATNCLATTDLTVYDFGLLCLGEDDEITRHLFGENSFSQQETFDTGIKCKECLALDEYMNSEAAVNTLARTVEELELEMKPMAASIIRLNSHVFNGTTQASGAPGAEPIPVVPDKFSDGFLHHDKQSRAALHAEAKKQLQHTVHTGLLAKRAQQLSNHRQMGLRRKASHGQQRHLRHRNRQVIDDDEREDESQYDDEEEGSEDIEDGRHEAEDTDVNEDEEQEDQNTDREDEDLDDDRQ